MFNDELIKEAYVFYRKRRFKAWNLVLHENPLQNQPYIVHNIIGPEESVLECSMTSAFIDYVSDFQAEESMSHPDTDITFKTKTGQSLYMYNASLNTFTDVTHPQVTFIGTVTRMSKEEFLNHKMPHKSISEILTKEHKMYLKAIEKEKTNTTCNRFGNLDLEE